MKVASVLALVELVAAANATSAQLELSRGSQQCCCRSPVESCWSRSGTYYPEMKACCKPKSSCHYSAKSRKAWDRRYDVPLITLENSEHYHPNTCQKQKPRTCCCATETFGCWSRSGTFLADLGACCKTRDVDQFCSYDEGSSKAEEKRYTTALFEIDTIFKYDHLTCKPVGPRRECSDAATKRFRRRVVMGTMALGGSFLVGMPVAAGLHYMAPGAGSQITAMMGNGAVQILGDAGKILPIPDAWDLTGKVAKTGMNMVFGNVFDYGNHHVACCCDETSLHLGLDCKLALPKSPNTAAHCSEEHPIAVPRERCHVPEVVQYSNSETVTGCQCRSYTDCSTNEPHEGHAWCKTLGSCGRRKWTSTKGSYWDFCKISGEPLSVVVNGEQVVFDGSRNDFLAAFEPHSPENVERAKKFALDSTVQGSLFLGAHVVETRGVVLASTECFASIKTSTVAECAEMCLLEGSLQLHRNTSWVHAVEVPNVNCTAFAYHPMDDRCLRLPPPVDHLVFEPFVKDWTNAGADGWVNYKLSARIKAQANSASSGKYGPGDR